MVARYSKNSLLIIIIILFVVRCSNPNSYYAPVAQAPYPYSTSPFLGTPSGLPYFTPYLPSSFPNQFTPFLPIYSYLTLSPFGGYWNSLWQNWQTYAYSYGYSIYNFNYFWFNYLPYVWQSTSMLNFYQFMSQSYYYWVTPQTVFPTYFSSPTYFWSNYSGLGWGAVQPMVYCGSFCVL